jgi:hypothetical protein
VSKTAVAESWENKTPSPVQIAEILRLHGAWLRGEADGARANLAGANLAGANLAGANLDGAYLARANRRVSGRRESGRRVSGRRESGRRVSGRRESGRRESGRRESGRRESGRRESGPRVSGRRESGRRESGGANLDGETRLPAGFAWKLYLSELVPALLTAGGKKLEEVANSETWGCHSWGSEGRELACPIATAFDVHQISDVPILYREQANFFIQVFDAKLVPLDAVLGKPAEVAAE